MTAPQTIHVVFKTHLDIGFTDHAEKVRRQYHERFIPQAIDTGTHFWRENPARPAFIWTTGAWLILDHLETQPRAAVRRLEEAIGRGLVRWHALPFTTHTELMSPALVRAGLSMAAELDRRFGMKTVAAKMTDVPGHTRGLVPLLAEAGVKFLHLGVNAASRVPDVPDVFRWRAADGSEVLVMYQKSYGATHIPEGFADGLTFAHTNDNLGPQSVSQTAEAYRELRHDFPNAELRAATLDDYAEILWPRREEFPVFDLEIGDSWIHGAASDPQKLAKFLALRRLYDTFAAGELTPRRLAFGRKLGLVAEHTWGVDVKSYLRDETVWDRAALAAARKSDFRFTYTEASWAEQRAYLDKAVAELDTSDRKLARQALATTRVPPAPKSRPTPARDGFSVGGWTISIAPETGDLAAITAPGGVTLVGRDGSLLGFRHQSYDPADTARFRQSYVTQQFDWALRDFDKPGLDRAAAARSAQWTPRLVDAAATRNRLILGLALPDEAHAALGAPEHLELRITPVDAVRLDLALVLRGKPANRMPEAGFLEFTPIAGKDWDFEKLGLWQPGDRIARNGGGGLQAVSAIRTVLPDGKALLLEPLDTPLVGPAGADFMRYDPAPPDLSQGLRFNLYNNKWGTNFAMWWDGDLLVRFTLTLGDAKG
jgi:hypothetical protein